MPATSLEPIQRDDSTQFFESAATKYRHLRAVVAAPEEVIQVPEPSARFVRALAAHAFEAVEGYRSITQLGPAISLSAARGLAVQRTANRERRSVYGDQRVSSPSPGKLFLSRISELVAEASVAIHTGQRTYAVSLRLEWTRGRWKASEIFVL